MADTPPTSTARPTPPSPARTPTTRCGYPTSSSKPSATTAIGSSASAPRGKVRKTLKARDLWRKVAEAAWACADPGVQFDTIINEWHTSPAGGKIRATNPCAEYVFLDNTACNLASINLVKFFDDDSNVFDTEGYEHAIRLWTITLEISVTMAHFPSREIAQGSYDYRTLGLGYANLGTLLMRMGLPYDSDAGRAVSGAITAILTGYSYATSAELAAAVGPFPRFAENREAMLRVIRNHRRAAYNTDQNDYEGLSHFVMGINPDVTPANLLTAARQSLGPRPRHGRAPRLPQRPGQRHCSDRDHRSADGLRHHRGRARLRAGQVQEAGRRRLLQDRQPVGHPRPREPRVTPTSRSRTSSATSSGPALWSALPTSTGSR